MTTYTIYNHPLRWIAWWMPITLIAACLLFGFLGNLLAAYSDIWQAGAGNPYSDAGITNPGLLALSKQADGLSFLMQWFAFMAGLFGTFGIIAKIGVTVHLKMDQT